MRIVQHLDSILFSLENIMQIAGLTWREDPERVITLGRHGPEPDRTEEGDAEMVAHSTCASSIHLTARSIVCSGV